MYRDFSSAVEGFTKNLFAFFDYHLLLYAVGWFWIAVSFLLPLVVLVSPAIGRLLNYPNDLAILAVLAALLIFALAYHRFRFPWYLILFYPLSLFMFTWLASRSLIHTLLGSRSWKGRRLPPPVIRL
jgi:chlorobactene glucosyltransferase